MFLPFEAAKWRLAGFKQNVKICPKQKNNWILCYSYLLFAFYYFKYTLYLSTTIAKLLLALNSLCSLIKLKYYEDTQLLVLLFH